MRATWFSIGTDHCGAFKVVCKRQSRVVMFSRIIVRDVAFRARVLPRAVAEKYTGVALSPVRGRFRTLCTNGRSGGRGAEKEGTTGGRWGSRTIGADEKEALAQLSISFLKFAAILYVMNNYLLEVTMCVGPSMLPTLNVVGDVLIVEKISKWATGLTVGDVVISSSPVDTSHTVCKRIKGRRPRPRFSEARKRYREDCLRTRGLRMARRR